jgi:hypothetical protein
MGGALPAALAVGRCGGDARMLVDAAVAGSGSKPMVLSP